MEHDASWNEGSKGAELWHGHIQPSDALKGENRKAAISPTVFLLYLLVENDGNKVIPLGQKVDQ